MNFHDHAVNTLTQQVATLSKEDVRAIAAGNREQDTLAVLYAPWCPFCQGMEANYSALAQELKGSRVKVAKYQVRLVCGSVVPCLAAA